MVVNEVAYYWLITSKMSTTPRSIESTFAIEQEMSRSLKDRSVSSQQTVTCNDNYDRQEAVIKQGE